MRQRAFATVLLCLAATLWAAPVSASCLALPEDDSPEAWATATAATEACQEAMRRGEEEAYLREQRKHGPAPWTCYVVPLGLALLLLSQLYWWARERRATGQGHDGDQA